MKKETDHDQNLIQVDKLERQERRARKTERKVKQVRQVRRRLRREELDVLVLVFVFCTLLNSCTAVKKHNYRSERDSIALLRSDSSFSEERRESISSLFESLSWEQDQQTALIRSDSSLVFQPDGSLHLQRGLVILSSARRQERAARQEHEREDVQARTQQTLQTEQAEVSENLRELDKKKPPGAMLLLPALVMAFAFLIFRFSHKSI